MYFRAICRSCWSRDLHNVEAAGTGTVYSFTIMYSVGDPALADELPYALALVDLDEGPRVISRITGDPASVRIGDRVRASFCDLDNECTLLNFDLEPTAGTPPGIPPDMTAADVCQYKEKAA
jgi:uncharacterized OB-fold protein